MTWVTTPEITVDLACGVRDVVLGSGGGPVPAISAVDPDALYDAAALPVQLQGRLSDERMRRQVFPLWRRIEAVPTATRAIITSRYLVE